VAFAGLVLLVHLLAEAHAFSEWPPCPPRILLYLRAPTVGGNLASHHTHAAAASIVLAAAAVPLAAVSFLPHCTAPSGTCPHGYVDLLVALGLSVAVGLLGVSTLVHVACAWRNLERRPAVLLAIALPVAWLMATVVGTVKMSGAHVGLDVAAWRAILCWRVGALGSGLSPLTPFIFFTVGLYVWHLVQIERVREIDSMDTLRVSRVFAGRKEAHGDVAVLESRLYQVLEVTMPAAIIGPTIALILGLLALSRVLPPFSTLEPCKWVQWALGIALGVVVAGSWVTLGVLIGARRRLGRLLSRLAHDPMVDAYDRLPRSYVRLLEQQLSGAVPDVRDLHVPLRELDVLLQNGADGPIQIPASGAPPAEAREAGANPTRIPLPTLAQLWQWFSEERCAAAEGGAWSSPLSRSKTADGLVRWAREIRTQIEELYQAPSLEHAAASIREHDASATALLDSDVASRSTLSLTGPRLTPSSELWFRLAEEFVACVTTLLLYPLLRHMRNLLMLATGQALLLMAGATCYAFQPRQALMCTVGAVTLATAVTAVSILVGLDRNELLSRIGKTPPGRVTFDRSFVLGLVTWGLMPILSLLAVQYPEVVAQVLAMLQPVASPTH
jgi:hypothetical protein